MVIMMIFTGDGCGIVVMVTTAMNDVEWCDVNDNDT